MFDLLYRHELDEMLLYLPEVEKKLSDVVSSRGKPLWQEFRTLCEQWTIYARYSPRLASREEARQFIETIREVKEWLKEL